MFFVPITMDVKVNMLRTKIAFFLYHATSYARKLKKIVILCHTVTYSWAP